MLSWGRSSLATPRVDIEAQLAASAAATLLGVSEFLRSAEQSTFGPSSSSASAVGCFACCKELLLTIVPAAIILALNPTRHATRRSFVVRPLAASA